MIHRGLSIIEIIDLRNCSEFLEENGEVLSTDDFKECEDDQLFKNKGRREDCNISPT